MAAKVVVVGSINVDLVIHTSRLPAPGETVIGGVFYKSHGGKGANQAVACARLGAETYLVGAVGNDEFGREARKALASERVDTSRVFVAGLPTGVAQIVVDEKGENLIAVASGANDELTAEQVAEALEAILAPGDVVLSNLEIPDAAVLAAARESRRRGCRFLLNPAPARPLPHELLDLCDILTPNEIEARALGLDPAQNPPPNRPFVVVVTRGSVGADLLRPGATIHHEDAFEVEVVDTTGAGDAFSATLAWAIACGYSVETAVRFAAAGGALATRNRGARTGFGNRWEVESLAATRA